MGLIRLFSLELFEVVFKFEVFRRGFGKAYKNYNDQECMFHCIGSKNAKKKYGDNGVRNLEEEKNKYYKAI